MIKKLLGDRSHLPSGLRVQWYSQPNYTPSLITMAITVFCFGIAVGAEIVMWIRAA